MKHASYAALTVLIVTVMFSSITSGFSLFSPPRNTFSAPASQGLQVWFDNPQFISSGPCAYLLAVYAKTSTDLSITNLHWDFGDGSTLDVPYSVQSYVTDTRSHIYASTGTFAVTVTAYDSAGNSGTTSLALTKVTPGSCAADPSSTQQSGTTLLYADFTGSTLPGGWNLQGSANFLGGLNTASGIGGIQLVNNQGGAEGTAVYASPLTAQNIVIEVSGAYGDAQAPTCNDADDIGVGFYSGGPSSIPGGWNPAAPNGYYASYEFYHDIGPALLYNAQGGGASAGAYPTGRIATGTPGALPVCGLNFLFTQTIVNPNSISMNELTRSSSPFTSEPSTTPTNLLTYSGTVDNSHSTLYIGGATGQRWTYQYVYWIRVLAYVPTPSISLSPNSGPVDSTVQVSGSGFAESDTTCSLSGSVVMSPSCSISGGTLTGSFTVANVGADSYTVTATGSPAGDSASTPFNVSPCSYTQSQSFISEVESDTCFQVGTSQTTSYTFQLSGLTFSLSPLPVSLALSNVVPNCVSGNCVTGTQFLSELANLMGVSGPNIPSSEFSSLSSYEHPSAVIIQVSSFLPGLTNDLCQVFSSEISSCAQTLNPLSQLTWKDGVFYLVLVLGVTSTGASTLPSIDGDLQTIVSLIKGISDPKEACSVISAAISGTITTLLKEFDLAVYITSDSSFKFIISLDELNTLFSTASGLLCSAIIIGTAITSCLAGGSCAVIAAKYMISFLASYLQAALYVAGITLPWWLQWIFTIAEPPGSTITPLVRNATTGAVILSPAQTVGSNALLLYDSQSGGLAFLDATHNTQYVMTLQGTGSSVPYYSRITDPAGDTIQSAGALNSTQITGGTVSIINGVATVKQFDVNVALSQSSVQSGATFTATVSVTSEDGSLTDASLVQVLFAGNVFYATHVSTGTYSVTLSTASLPAGSYPVLASAFELGYFNGAGSQILAVTAAILPTVTLTTGVASGQGSVDPNCPNGCSETVGSSVTVTASPSSGWEFATWSSVQGVSCSSSPCTFTVPNNAVVLEATFNQIVSGPTISSVSQVVAANSQSIYIYGLGFGNTYPQTVAVGDGSVDTVACNVNTPSLAIWDTSGGSHDWSAGRNTCSNTDAIGIIIVSWSNTEIVLGGFGSALSTTGTGTWNISPGDSLTLNVWGPNNNGQAQFNIVVSGSATTTSSTTATSMTTGDLSFVILASSQMKSYSAEK